MREPTVVKVALALLPPGADGRQANHDDQGQHDGVLDCRRAVFLLNELNHPLL